MSSAVDEDTRPSHQQRPGDDRRAPLGCPRAPAEGIYRLSHRLCQLLLRAPRGRLGLPRGDREGQMNEEIAGSTDIITRTPFEVILLQAKIGMITGAVVAIPALLFFSRKAIRRRGYHSVVPISKGYIAGFVVMALSLFVAGSSTPTPSSSRTRSASSRGTPSAPASNPVTGSPSSPSSWRC